MVNVLAFLSKKVGDLAMHCAAFVVGNGYFANVKRPHVRPLSYGNHVNQTAEPRNNHGMSRS